MIKTPLFRKTLAILFIIGVLDLIGNLLYLHYSFWWYDVILHFLGGSCVGMASILAWNYFSPKPVTSKLKMVLIAFIGSIVIGVLWEIFEVYFSITFLSDGVIYIRDTASDLLMDVCGGFFGALYSHKLLNE